MALCSAVGRVSSPPTGLVTEILFTLSFTAVVISFSPQLKEPAGLWRSAGPKVMECSEPRP